MPQRENEDFQLYLSRIRPIYHQLFNIAHAITGSCERAEYSLQYAMMDYWAASAGSRHGFRESLRNTLIHAAIRAGQGEAEFTWNSLTRENLDEESDPIRRQMFQESIELRRILALKYGCGLSHRQIGRIMGVEAKRVQTALSRFEARCRRKMDAAQKRRCESMIVRAVREEFALPCPIAPEIGVVFRTFQADAAAMTRSSRLPMRLVQGAIAVILALICVAGFWLAAVLIQPPVLEEPTSIMEILEE